MHPPIQSKVGISSTADSTLTKLEEAIQQASGQYFRLVILAGVPGSGKTAILQVWGLKKRANIDATTHST